MPAYRVPVDVQKIKDLMEKMNFYKVYAFAEKVGMSGGAFSSILHTGFAGPKALYRLKSLYKEAYEEEMPAEYFELPNPNKRQKKDPKLSSKKSK